MREIKFRAWDKERKDLFDVVAINYKKKRVYSSWNEPNGSNLYAEFDRVVLMQSACMKDKNGKEIYEGDIVENTTQTVYLGDKYEVVWNKNYAGYQLMSNGFTSNIPLIQNFMSYKVLGNIYENPELLEVQS